MEGLLFVLAVIGFIVYMAFKTLSQIKNFTIGKTHEDYKINYPDSIREGKVYCYNCNTHDIFMKQVGSTPKSALNSHICRNCGTELFRSKTVL